MVTTDVNLIKYSDYKEMVEKHKQQRRKEDAADTVLLCMTCQHPREQHVFKVLGSEAPQTQTQQEKRTEDLKVSDDDTEGYIICLGFGQFAANPCTCNEFSATSPPTWTY
jgi:hypothetical protein